MKAISLTCILYCLVVQTAFSQDLSLKYSETIKLEELKKHLSIIASDEMEGREAGSKGQEMAAEYIRNHFENIGLTPIQPQKNGENGYFQEFPLYKKDWEEAFISVNGKRYDAFTEFYPNGIVNIPSPTTTEVVFVGYGIDSKNYNDYHNLDVRNKTVIMWAGLPKGKNGEDFIAFHSKPTFDSETAKDKFYEKAKIDEAYKRGATTVLIISDVDAESFKRNAAERSAILGRYSRTTIDKKEETPTSKQAAFIISQALASEIIKISPKKVNKLKALISKKHTSVSSKVKPSQISIQMNYANKELSGKNVLGFLEGSDKKEEVVVITAHYDHIGMNSKGEVYNGADDDGSGTCAVLEISEAFALAKKEGNGPRRSILFMTVTGEEKGLLGSRYFTDVSPTIPLDKVMCDLNIDMIGRIDKNHSDNERYVYLIGSDKLSSDLHSVSEEANKRYINYDLDYTFNDPNDPNRFYYRSDHYNFAKNNIPVIFYFSGVHEDYHGLGDEVEKILFPKYTEITKLVFHTAWELSNRNDRLKVDSNKK